ncbi:hypothetical protein K9N50_06190 [bacterium]|nr:hypothetical protein [bacterium]
MIINQPDWQKKLFNALVELCNKYSVKFCDLMPGDLPPKSGVYLITKITDEYEIPYWVEWTDNIKVRISSGLLMGGFAEKSLKRELIEKKICIDVDDAKKFLREKCSVRWLRVKDTRFQNALTYYARAILLPRCGLLEKPQKLSSASALLDGEVPLIIKN